MLDKVFTNHLTDLQTALTLTTQRQGLLTQNLANVNVPGYKRQDIDFHAMLQSEVHGSKVAQPQVTTDQSSLRSDGNNVDIEREMTGISETDLHYQALTQMTSDLFAGLKNVIREGK